MKPSSSLPFICPLSTPVVALWVTFPWFQEHEEGCFCLRVSAPPQYLPPECLLRCVSAWFAVLPLFLVLHTVTPHRLPHIHAHRHGLGGKLHEGWNIVCDATADMPGPVLQESV